MDTRWLISRRALLGGLSAAGISALLPRTRVRAQNAILPRLILVHVPEGMWGGAPRPAVGGASLGQIFGALDPYKSKIAVMNNLNMESRDHGPGGDGHHRGVPHMFTGIEMQNESNAGGASIDQKIASRIGGDSQFASLQFAVRIVYGDTNSRCIWSGPGRVVSAMQSPYEAYNRIMSGLVPTGGEPTPAPAVNLRKSALDYALDEIGRLRTRLPAADRERMDSYQESLRDIERRLAITPGPVASSCTAPTLGSAVDVKSEGNYPKIGQLQMDMIVAALQCGVTRVASLQWGNSNDQCTYSWLGVNTLGHDMAHNNSNCDPNGAKKLKVYQWYAEQAKYLVEKLSSIQEGEGTMLDNTVILWASEFSESNGHNSNQLLWLLMGNAGGYFKTGNVINLNGRSTNDVHITLQNAFGIADTTFGGAAYCNGAIAEIKA